jgi:acyl-CoA thioester hydrolase
VPPFVHHFRARYHECDAQGVVFNAHHVTYVDVTLTELWRAVFGSYGGMVDEGFDVVVADVHASYRQPIRFDEQVALALTIERFGTASMTTSWVTSVDERVCVEGEIVHVFVDPVKLTPLAIPDHARERLARYSRSGATARR